MLLILQICLSTASAMVDLQMLPKHTNKILRSVSSPLCMMFKRTHLIAKAAPLFEGQAVFNGAFKKVSLSDYKGKYLVKVWIPYSFTFVCPTELLAFSDKFESFKKLNTEVLFASCDSQFSNFHWTQMSRKMGGVGNLKYPLLSDPSKEIAIKYNVLMDDMMPLRATFIIDDKGKVRNSTFNDRPVGRSVEETLRLVEAFQYTDKHGEVCPADWNSSNNSKTMKADVKDSLKYFSTLKDK
eukprot:NODE_508_length_7458_cov_0.132491.p4 type:complete len:240 gc:universal NODE_508_length_7458_cov_0.132491:5491-4772(-)